MRDNSTLSRSPVRSPASEVVLQTGISKMGTPKAPGVTPNLGLERGRAQKKGPEGGVDREQGEEFRRRSLVIKLGAKLTGKRRCGKEHGGA